MDDDEPADPVVPVERPVAEEGPARNPRSVDICLTIETVDLYKKSDCRFYVKCLDVASIAGWQQFHCNDCKAYVPLPEETRQNKTLLRLAMLLEKVRESEGDFLRRNENKDEDDDE